MRRLLAALTLCISLLCPIALPVHAQQGKTAQQEQKTETVFITRTGKRYHRDGCRYLASSKIPVSLTGAKARGYTACKVCHPLTVPDPTRVSSLCASATSRAIRGGLLCGSKAGSTDSVRGRGTRRNGTVNSIFMMGLTSHEAE